MNIVNQAKCVILMVFMAAAITTGQAHTLVGTVTSQKNHAPIEMATVFVAGQELYCYTNEKGEFLIDNIAPGNITLHVQSLGYTTKILKMPIQHERTRINVRLSDGNLTLDEVLITATESKGLVSASEIDRSAMKHLQPTSFADLMELVPGGMSQDPNMGVANTITMRETGTIKNDGTKGQVGKDYSITSLGTQFVVDGVPMNTDANLQEAPISSTFDDRLNMVNRGVDMRAITTDDIEHVEIIRGIPSAEYGNLTSGVINIKKIRKETPVNIRFKADGYNKLVAVGKGFALAKGKGGILNFDLGYLDAKPDPRNNLINYKRMNGGLRYTYNKDTQTYEVREAVSVDYTGSIDNAKEDPQLNYGNVDEYKSLYNRAALSNVVSFSFPQAPWCSKVELNTAVNAQFDRLERTKLVAPQRYMLVPTTSEPGEHDAVLNFKEYVADYVSDGKPFNAFVKLKADFFASHKYMQHNIKVGAEYNYTKNFGEGQMYDLTRPLEAGSWTTRPRAYKDIPALQNLGFYAEDLIKAQFGNHKLDIMLGVRTQALMGMDERYYLNNRFYVDPRFNIMWTFPRIPVKKHALVISLGGGVGQTTKMPTIDYLYPTNYYMDIIQLGYYDQNKPAENSRFNVMSYVVDRTNYDLKPARNFKWEVRVDFSLAGNRLSVNYFNEKMEDGFRYMNIYNPYTYKEYNSKAITPSELMGPPDLATIPYEYRTILDGYSKAENGSQIVKEGVEFQFHSQRIKPLRTVIHVNGAWIRTTYNNSMKLMKTVSASVDGKSVPDYYVGLYNMNDGYIYSQFNTNFMLDTQIPEWGLVFSTSVQCMWYTTKQALYKDGVPESYLATDGEFHPYTEQSMVDPMLQKLPLTYSPGMFDEYKVPIALYVNLKVTKKITKYIELSFFANKLLDYTPSFESDGKEVRRNVNPYFGIELNLSF